MNFKILRQNLKCQKVRMIKFQRSLYFETIEITSPKDIDDLIGYWSLGALECRNFGLKCDTKLQICFDQYFKTQQGSVIEVH